MACKLGIIKMEVRTEIKKVTINIVLSIEAFTQRLKLIHIIVTQTYESKILI